MAPKRPTRQRKNDRLLNSQATELERRGDMLLAPFDAKSREMDLKWGVQRLPELMSVDTAAIWGQTLANLSIAQDALFLSPDGPQALADLKSCVESGIRGFDYMDAEAEREGKPKADTTIWEIEVEGRKVAIAKDIDAWPAIKAARPDLRVFSLREAAVALLGLAESPTLMAIKDEFPQAQVTAIRPKSPVNFAVGENIPF